MSAIAEPVLHPFFGLDAAWLVEDRARVRGDHPLLIWAPFDRPAETISYAAFADAVARTAGGLAARGIRAGDRVLVHFENCPETLIARFACAWLGAVAVLGNAHLAGAELPHVTEPLGVRAAITQPKLFARIAENCPGLDWIAVSDTDAGEPAAAGTAPQKADRFAALAAEPLPRRAPDPTAPAAILFTTGSTARPKAVLWTHANMLWGGKVGTLQQRLTPDDVYQVHLPLFHVVGFSWSFLPAMWAGATALLQPRFSTSRFWPAALAHRATTSSHAGTDGFLRNEPVPAHAMRQWMVSAYSPERESRFRVASVAGWGMTEMVTCPIASDPFAAQAPGSIGRPWPGYEIRIEGEDGRPVGPGETGHLLVGARRGLSIFREYVENPAAMAEAFDERGFFRTGDRVTLNPDGSIRFSDRIKDMIKVGGEGVSASEVEAAIGGAGGVEAVAVVGRPDPTYGEVTVAFVVLAADRAADPAGAAAAIEAHCRANLAKFKVPREVRVIPELPRVGNNKIDRKVLRDAARADAAAGKP